VAPPLLLGELLERQTELAAVDAMLDAACDGQGGLLVVVGPGGIGKSRLLQEARVCAEGRQMEALGARGGELERAFAFGVVRQLFEPALAAGSDRERRDLLSGAARFAKAALSDRLLHAGTHDHDASYATLHGLYWLAANLAARRPLLIAVDDAHLSDSASLRWLAYLIKRIEGLPILILLSARSADREAEHDLLDELISDPLAHLLRPAPLSEMAAAQLVRESLSFAADDEFCAACHAATHGNPFLLRELLTELELEGLAPSADNAPLVPTLGPKTVSRFVLRRLGRLPEAAALVADAAAVLGDGADLRQVAELAGLDSEVAADAAEALQEIEILRDDEQLAFAHPIVRSAIYADLGLAERQSAHARAARLLHAEGAAINRVVFHLLAAERAGDPWVVQTLRDAARAAIARGARTEAVACLRRALEEPPPPATRIDVALELGRAEVHAHGSQGLEQLRDALELTREPVRRAEIALELGRLLSMMGDWPRACAVFDRAIAEIGSSQPDLALRLEAELISVALADLSTSAMARERLARIRDELGGASPTNRTLLASLAVAAVMEGASREHAAGLARRALEAQPVDSEESSRTLAFIGNALVWTDELDLAADLWDDALALARRRGSVLLFATASCFRSNVACRSGALIDAEADARAALEALDPAAWGFPAPIYPLAFLIEALVERGSLIAAEDALRGAHIPAELPELAQFNRLLFGRAGLRLAEGRIRDGIDDLLECGRRLEAFGMRNPTAIPWRSSAALGLLATGEHEAARRLADEELALARRFGAPRALGIALRAAGLVEGGERGTERLREAVSVLEGSPSSLELARVLVDLGAALRRRGRRVDARGPLREGLDLAVRCAAAPVADRAQEELVATGARPRRAMSTGVRALTASEERVARMAMAGPTNREIAQALFVTEKTVEMHLSNAYRKLGISSRSQLTRVLAE
jgi:DNA-binding CsgD family transcriptional regulator